MRPAPETRDRDTGNPAIVWPRLPPLGDRSVSRLSDLLGLPASSADDDGQVIGQRRVV